MGHQTDFAALYSKVCTWQRDLGVELINQARPRPGEVVLDIGSGTGGLTALLARRVGPRGKVIGVDPNGSRIALARATAEQEPHDISYVEGRGEEMSWLTSNSVDLVYSNFTFHWVADKRSLVREVLRCLRPGGRFVFMTGGGLSPFFADSLNLAGLRGQAVMSKLCFLTDREWRTLLVKEGFQVKTAALVEHPIAFEDSEAFFDWLEASTDGTFRRDSLSERDRAELEHQIAYGVETALPSVTVVANAPLRVEWV